MDRLRQWSRVVAVALCVVGLGLRPGSALACVGDCDGDGRVAINELVVGVNIALGSQLLSACEQFDCEGSGTVPINCLIQGVNGALTGCPATPTATAGSPTITLTGSCATPGTGGDGLMPCDTGTPIVVFRCDDRAQCLHRQGLTMVGATTVASGGGWSVQVPPAGAGAPLIFQAGIAEDVVYRTLGFGSSGDALRASLARGVIFAPVAISPVTEAAVELLDANGFENYSDTGAQQVLRAVQQAAIPLSFDGLTGGGGGPGARDRTRRSGGADGARDRAQHPDPHHGADRRRDAHRQGDQHCDARLRPGLHHLRRVHGISRLLRRRLQRRRGRRLR